MDSIAFDAVYTYLKENKKLLHMDKNTPPIHMHITWKCKALQNYKWLVCTDLPDSEYYEVTYNGDKRELYLDVYVKTKNILFPNV